MRTAQARFSRQADRPARRCRRRSDIFGNGEVIIKREFLAHVADALFDGLRLADNVAAGHPATAVRKG
jgi:hypothetical protein